MNNLEDDPQMDSALRLQVGQQALTPAQEAEVRRFAEERIAVQLSIEPVDEPEAEAFLCQAYQRAKLEPPKHMYWVDGPLQLVAELAPPSVVISAVDSEWDSGVWESEVNGRWDYVVYSVRDRVGDKLRPRVRASVRDRVWHGVGASVLASVWHSVGASVQGCVGASVQGCVGASVRAYFDAPWLAYYSFFDAYLAPNSLHALAHFNTLVSGYWLGQDRAILVRRPRVLARDGAGRLHCTTGKCLEYQDGSGFYAWHGVRVPEQVIMDPDSLTREDFLYAANVEVRRVIQERMGSRFVPELGGVVIDSGLRGTLYEVVLPNDDPERVARYVQVQDATTLRQYFLRVPPRIQTAAEAVAWTFQVGVEDYRPAQET